MIQQTLKIGNFLHLNGRFSQARSHIHVRESGWSMIMSCNMHVICAKTLTRETIDSVSS